jgi:uncharacterized membrane protein
MKNLIVRDWLILVLLLAPFVFIAFTFDMFPEKVPVHFNLNGEPDRYSDKSFGLFLMPILNVILYVFLRFLPLMDPKRKNYQLFEGKYWIIRMITHVLIAFVFSLMAAYSLGYKFDLTLVVMYSVVLLLLVFGNYMGNIRSNYFVGIRTPWTLSNDDVWKRTHRFTGKLWVFSSLAMLVALPFTPNAVIALIVFVGIIGIIPIVYSYVIHRELSKTH